LHQNAQLKMQGHYPTASHEMGGITAVAVMGVTGSGKSNFIKHATNSDRIKVGHNMESCKKTNDEG
jgi:ABC-type lipoprotein export system ATPase subunit